MEAERDLDLDTVVLKGLTGSGVLLMRLTSRAMGDDDCAEIYP